MPRVRSRAPTKVPGTFGHRLMTCRRERGLTQTELAGMIGVSQRVISYYENETQYPPSTILVKLAEALAIKADVLLCIDDPIDRLLTHDTILARKFIEAENLPAADRKTIVQVVEALLAKQRSA